MRKFLTAPLILMCSLAFPADADLSISYNSPGVRIGIDVPVYPRLQRIPGYPVYYAPAVNSNYFFYDGLYWVYDADNWYESTWYNGPWRRIEPDYVPVYLLRVPVRYYRHAPAYFRGWRADSPPRWGEHWGNSWQQRRNGWDQWNRRSAPAAAPLPAYQGQYSGTRYPQQAQQPDIQTRNYRYQPRDAVAQQRFQQQRVQSPAVREPQPVRESLGRGQERSRDRGADREHGNERDRSQDRNQGRSKGRDKDDR